MKRYLVVLLTLGSVACATGEGADGAAIGLASVDAPAPYGPQEYGPQEVAALAPSCALVHDGARLAPTFAPELAVMVGRDGAPLCVDTWAALELTHLALYRAAASEARGDMSVEEPLDGEVDTGGVDESDPSPRP